MTGEIRVHVVDYGRTFLQMRYLDPDTGKQVLKSTRQKTRKKAEKVAAVWEEKLNSGRSTVRGSMSWAAFREKYEDLALPAMKQATRDKIDGVLNSVERHLRPARLKDFTSQRLTKYESDLRAAKRREATIKGHLAHIRAMLQWAVDQEWLPEVPKMPKSKQKKRRRGKAKVMKGRPLTGVEYRRMLRKTQDVVGRDRGRLWRWYQHGLWLSGLRLEESLQLWWDRDDGLRVVDVGDRLMLRIPEEIDKGNEDRILPISPEFELFLRKVPNGDRVGRVFKLGLRESTGRLTMRVVSRIISDIGKAANVIVDDRKGKYASAHDFRRSFGDRWAKLVMPQVLMELMRHEDISTTMRYYVAMNAEATAKVLWDAKKRHE